jgi:hypothetical protein
MIQLFTTTKKTIETNKQQKPNKTNKHKKGKI